MKDTHYPQSTRDLGTDNSCFTCPAIMPYSDCCYSFADMPTTTLDLLTDYLLFPFKGKECV